MDRPQAVAGPDTTVDPAGERTRYTYDDAGRLQKQEQPKGVKSATTDDFATVYTYDLLDRVIRETTHGIDTTAAQTRNTHLCYDVPGDLRSVTSPRANLATLTCPGDGPATVGYTAKHTYDLVHRRLTSADPAGHVTRTTYDAHSNVTATEADIESGRIARTEVTYDQRDMPVKMQERFDGDARKVTTLIEYDGNRNRTKVVSPRGYDTDRDGPYDANAFYVTFMSYDGANRLTKVELPHDAADGAERQYVHHQYDANGSLTKTSLPVTASNSGDVGNLAWTKMDHYDPGWIRTSDDPTNPKVTFDYTPQGWQASRVPDFRSAAGTPDSSQRMRWTYFADGMLQARSDTRQQASTYRYDENNNLLFATQRGTGDSRENPIDIKATYTGFNQPAKVSQRKQGVPNWTFTSYGYDQNGNTTSRNENGEEDNAGLQVDRPRVHTMAYDQADWLDFQLDLGVDGTDTCKDDQRIDNDYFGTGWEKERIIRRADTGCTSSNSGAWPLRQTTAWRHFDNGKLRTLTTRNGSGVLTESHDVGYLNNGVYVNGNRVTDQYVLVRAAGTAGVTTCVPGSVCDAKFTYDARDRLVSHQLRSGRVDTYKLDEPGNLLVDNTIRGGNATTEVKNGVTTSKRYTANQLTEVSRGGATGRYWYDDFGNVDCLTTDVGSQADCSPSDGVAGSTELVVDYGYDYLQRLVGVRQYSGGSRTDRAINRYDAVDRVSVQEEFHTGTGNDRSTELTYQGLSGLVTKEVQAGGTGATTKTFSYDAYGHRVSMTSKVNTDTGDPQPYTFGYDVHSSVSQLLDKAGQVRASYGYDAYGGADAEPTDDQALTTGDTHDLAPLNPYRYSGMRMDSGTVNSASGSSALPNGSGGYDMGARRYGPDTASFLQQDLYHGALANLGLSLDPLTQNRYALAGGNPISYVETDGHEVTVNGTGSGTTRANPRVPSKPLADQNESPFRQISPNVAVPNSDPYADKMTVAYHNYMQHFHVKGEPQFDVEMEIWKNICANDLNTCGRERAYEFGKLSPLYPLWTAEGGLASIIAGSGVLVGLGAGIRLGISAASVRTGAAGAARAEAGAVNAVGGTQNCVACAIAGDSTLAGRPASATNLFPGRPIPGGNALIEKYAGASWRAVSGRAAVESELLAAGNGARGIVYGTNGTEAHVWNAVVQRGRVNFVDFQGIGPSGPASFNEWSTFYFVRTN